MLVKLRVYTNKAKQYRLKYRIVQNTGWEKFWQISGFKALQGKLW